MKSLHKSLDILECIINAEGNPLTPAQVAEKCNINAVTAVRIMGELTKRSYLRKVSRHTGYTSGPVIYALADRRCFYGCMSNAAKDPLKKLAIAMDIQINISVLNGGCRYILHHYSTTMERPVQRETVHTMDFYTTGTGRILMAYAESNDIDEIVARCGLPGENWPEVNSRRDLDMHLKRIAKNSTTVFPGSSGANIPVNIYGVAVKVEGFPVCAIGTNVNANRYTPNLLTAIQETAEEIKTNFNYERKSF